MIFDTDSNILDGRIWHCLHTIVGDTPVVRSIIEKKKIKKHTPKLPICPSHYLYLVLNYYGCDFVLI